ncbi:thiamine pyrophosphate protein [Neobacillus bataviensis LMG 21833]|uniref:Thiamine pyrophosphate protein n=1 Tax=Neobacillus bataviensis LMG 21833 TaxID=1117379 RepID=K6BZC6_9BACI|nr:thiamine pyrophosphate protein [Neobacillus bataviensis LMG 21833]
MVLGLGTRFSQITTQEYTLLTDTANLIHVDISPDEIGKVHTPSLAIAADINEFLKHLLPNIEANNNPTRIQLVSTLHEQYIEYSTPKQD